MSVLRTAAMWIVRRRGLSAVVDLSVIGSQVAKFTRLLVSIAVAGAANPTDAAVAAPAARNDLRAMRPLSPMGGDAIRAGGAGQPEATVTPRPDLVEAALPVRAVSVIQTSSTVASTVLCVVI